MHATRLLFWITISLFLYQNCGQGNQDDSAFESQDTDPFTTELGSLDLNRPLLLKLDQSEIEMQLSNGQILASENPVWEGKCLQQNLLNEISNFLANNSLCKRDIEQSQDTFCAQIYTFPYLELFIEDQSTRTKVGEKNNACPETMIHFCENDLELENIFRSLSFPNDLEECL